MTHPDGSSPLNLKRGEWVPNGRGTKDWVPSPEIERERKDIAHFHTHGSPHCRQCVRGMRLSERSTPAQDDDAPQQGRIITLKTNEN